MRAAGKIMSATGQRDHLLPITQPNIPRRELHVSANFEKTEWKECDE